MAYYDRDTLVLAPKNRFKRRSWAYSGRVHYSHIDGGGCTSVTLGTHVTNGLDAPPPIRSAEVIIPLNGASLSVRCFENDSSFYTEVQDLLEAYKGSSGTTAMCDLDKALAKLVWKAIPTSAIPLVMENCLMQARRYGAQLERTRIAVAYQDFLEALKA